MDRRLAAIMVADVVGYSRLMEGDEVGTFTALRANHSDLIAPAIAQKRGRIVKLIGDGVLVEFTSVVDAVSCATEIQASFRKRNEGTAQERRIDLRIGVHLGDVIVEDDDLYGDGVNVAARIESLADPGGICISQQALDHVETKIDFRFVSLGEQNVKNIERPLHVYKIVLDGSGAPKPYSTAPNARRRLVFLRAAGVVACLIIVGLVGAWLRPWEAPIKPATIERMVHALPERPSLAVLPFANMSDGPGQQHFVDGLSEDLITDLSRINGLFVIARNSTFAYRNQSVSIARVAEELGVRYVLEGSVRRDGAKLRVNAQLIDAITGGHVWAERYDGVATDVFTVQDMFVSEIVKALKVSLTVEEAEEIALGQTANLSAREVFQKGWEDFLRYTPETNASAAALLEQAVGMDPEYGRAYAALGLIYLRGCQLRWNEPLGMSVDMANSTAQIYLEKMRKWPSALANVASSGIHLYNNRHDDALTEATRAIATDPNDPEAYIAMAWSMITTGNPAAGLEFISVAMRLNPTYPTYYVFPQATANYAMGNIRKTVSILTEAIDRDPGATELAPLLAASYAQLGERQKARDALSYWQPKASQQELERALRQYHFPYKWSDGSNVLMRLTDGLQLAVLPLGTTVSSLIGDLSSESHSERRAAAATLGLFGAQAVEAVPALISALADEKRLVRIASVIALGKIGSPANSALPALTAIEDEQIIGRYAKAAIRSITGQ